MFRERRLSAASTVLRLSFALQAKHSSSLLQALVGSAAAWPWAYHSFGIKSLTLALWGLRAAGGPVILRTSQFQFQPASIQTA